MSLITFIDYFGTFVFAISGVLAAVEKKFDLFGAIILGLVTAIGGGTLRDLLIGSTPVGWMQDEYYIYLILSAVPICYFFKNRIINLRRSIFLFDTIGIGLFTILGLQKTLSFGLSPTVAVMMGIVSAVFGGVIRDVLSNQIPLIFRKEIYAFACLAGALVFLLANALSSEPIAMVISVLSVIVIRVLAIRRHWALPFNP
ncbi:MAG: trimeric intracellular cation channel family protein [Bacteroidota bacterium]